MPFLQLDDARLYYEVHGPADAPPLVFAHGAGGNHLSWWQQVPHFSKGHRCLTFDHRGFGQSVETSGARGGAAFTDDLLALMDHVGMACATLVAQSMGGWTCLHLARRYPERVDRLVMCDTHGGVMSEEIGAAWMQGVNAMSALPPGVHPAAGMRMATEQPALHFLYTQINGLSAERAPHELMQILAAAGTLSPEAVAGITLPVLFIVGEEDMVIPPHVCELAAALFQSSKIVRVEHAGHSVYFERAAEFNVILDHFLR